MDWSYLAIDQELPVTYKLTHRGLTWDSESKYLLAYGDDYGPYEVAFQDRDQLLQAIDTSITAANMWIAEATRFREKVRASFGRYRTWHDFAALHDVIETTGANMEKACALRDKDGKRIVEEPAVTKHRRQTVVEEWNSTEVHKTMSTRDMIVELTPHGSGRTSVDPILKAYRQIAKKPKH
ncbi:unnamed protein product, partial [Mesorhabditis spiculigera]